MTREDFTTKIKNIIGYNIYDFICFDEYHTRIGFKTSTKCGYEYGIISYETMDKIYKLTNNKNIKTQFIIPYDGGYYCELIIKGFTID